MMCVVCVFLCSVVYGVWCVVYGVCVVRLCVVCVFAVVELCGIVAEGAGRPRFITYKR